MKEKSKYKKGIAREEIEGGGIRWGRGRERERVMRGREVERESRYERGRVCEIGEIKCNKTGKRNSGNIEQLDGE